MQKTFLRTSASLLGCAVIFAVLSPVGAMHGAEEEEGLEGWRRYAHSDVPRNPDPQTVRDELARVKEGLQYLLDHKHLLVQSQINEVSVALGARVAALPDEPPAQAPQ